MLHQNIDVKLFFSGINGIDYIRELFREIRRNERDILQNEIIQGESFRVYGIGKILPEKAPEEPKKELLIPQKPAEGFVLFAHESTLLVLEFGETVRLLPGELPDLFFGKVGIGACTGKALLTPLPEQV
jgi:hypothetical protein